MSAKRIPALEELYKSNRELDHQYRECLSHPMWKYVAGRECNVYGWDHVYQCLPLSWWDWGGIVLNPEACEKRLPVYLREPQSATEPVKPRQG